MFHIELRQAPHHLHRFNLGEQELTATVLEPWIRGALIEMGERIWDPSAASIVVLEGPEIPIGRLTMGRGWAVAQREGTNVTERVMAAAREALIASAASAAEATVIAEVPGSEGTIAQTAGAQIGPTDTSVLADALGLELLRGLGQTPMSLLAAWRTAAQRHPQMPIGVTLDLTRGAVSSLVGSCLAHVLAASGQDAEPLQQADLDAALASIDSWTTEAGPAALWIRRA
jgi:hypothetical protein